MSKIKKILINFTFALFLLCFFISFNFQDGRSGGWYLQYLPNLNGTQVNDVFFLDSLTGFFCTSLSSGNAYICKTTNSGDNWSIKKSNIYPFQRIFFCDNNNGFCSSWDTLFKTTNSGENWNPIPITLGFWIVDMFVLNKDTLWAVDGNSLVGGIFRTTNGGQSWTVQYSEFGNNPQKIYMFNKNLGFASDMPGDTVSSQLWRTTNSGLNWNIVPGAKGFEDMHFNDSLTGWKANTNIQKTTNGGLNWQTQIIPHLSYYSFIHQFAFINNDIAFGAGLLNYNGKGILYKTTNGGIIGAIKFPILVLIYHIILK
jgi:photosystem II stability/assembly factor-like uncharacterized protein